MIKMNNPDSWRAFLRHLKMHKFVLSRGGGGGQSPPPPPPPPPDSLPGLCPGPTGGLGCPLDPRPNLLFSKMTVVSFYSENPVKDPLIMDP